MTKYRLAITLAVAAMLPACGPAASVYKAPQLDTPPDRGNQTGPLTTATQRCLAADNVEIRKRCLDDLYNSSSSPQAAQGCDYKPSAAERARCLALIYGEVVERNFVFGVEQSVTLGEPMVRVKTGAYASKYRNFEIVYSGLDAGSMRFVYREYTDNDLARAAFALDFAYPVGTAEVRFKDVVIDVRVAEPAQITYTVRSDGG